MLVGEDLTRDLTNYKSLSFLHTLIRFIYIHRFNETYET